MESEKGLQFFSEAERLAEHLPNSMQNIGLSGHDLCEFFRQNLHRLGQEVHERWEVYQQKVAEGDLARTQASNAQEQQKALGSMQHWLGLQSKYLGQFLVDQLSQRGLIPTYSFPVHSLSLEVVTEKGQKFGLTESDVVLNRDAALGISEYAPSSEVVANGRIWRSAGLAYYPRMFMPTEFYVACLDCHHVDVAVAKEDVPTACSNCGSQSNRRTRPFIQPRGFVTPYEERTGKDPGMHRRRPSKADEARLITIPREDVFSASDHPAVRKAILRAIPASDEEQEGRLVIVNRAARKHGYNICLLCNYGEPSKKVGLTKVSHKNPLDGKPCPNGTIYQQLDLAHIFETDVLLMRLHREIPSFGAESQALQRQEGFSRTIVEAIRFAAAHLLEIQPTEVRATFRKVGRYLEIILYDAIAGGAGYCVRLSRDVTIRNLFEEALRILECSRACSAACTSCLCDYSNQLSWDQFDRHAVIPWLKELADSKLSSIFEEMGCSRWEKPSLAGLFERLTGENHLTVFGIAPPTDDACDEKTVQWLIDWLNQGKTASIVFLTKPALVPGKLPSEFRKALRYFYPFAKDGRLQIGWLEKLNDMDSGHLPRICSGNSGTRTLLYSDRPSSPIFDCLLPEPCYVRKIDSSLGKELDNLFQKICFFSAEQLGEGAPLKRWELAENQPRKFDEYFESFVGQHVEHLQIRDPYCGIQGLQRESLVVFIKKLVEISLEISKITIFCKEQNSKDDRHQPSYVVQKELSEMLKSEFPSLKTIVHVYPFKSGKKFHDRSLEFIVLGSDGASTSHHFDLSGGIDYLMDVKRATKIYWYKK